MPSRVSWVIKGALAVTVLLILGFGQFARSEGNSEIARKTFFEKYFKFAFSGSDRLVKPRGVPNISYLCSSQSCRKTVEDLSRVIPHGNEQTSGSVLRSDTLIDVLFYADDADRSNNGIEYDLSPKLKIAAINDPKCAVVRFTEDFVVKKVVITVVEDAGPRNNLSCILNEMLRGTGLSILQTYGDYSRYFLKLSDQELLQSLNGISNLMTVHWSKRSEPGMTKEEVLDRLRDMSIQKN